MHTRYGQRQISLSLTVIVKSKSPQCCKSRLFPHVFLTQFVREIITLWIESTQCCSEGELKSSAKFLPLEFGFLCFETYALYTSLDVANALLYFLNQTPTGKYPYCGQKQGEALAVYGAHPTNQHPHMLPRPMCSVRSYASVKVRGAETFRKENSRIWALPEGHLGG